MEDLSVETVRRSLLALQDVVRCSICLETVHSDLVYCGNLHLTCSECKGHNKTCPMCRQPFSTGKPPRFVTQVVEALPPRCKNQNCGKYIEPDDDHEQFCGFKVTLCKLCKWIGKGKDIWQHVREYHTVVTVYAQNITPTTWSSFKLNEKISCFTPFLFFGHFFWEELISDPEKQLFSQTFYLVPNGKPKFNIFVKLAFTSKEGPEFMCKIKLKMDEDINVKEDNNIRVPWILLPNFINNETEKLQFTLSVTKV